MRFSPSHKFELVHREIVSRLQKAMFSLDPVAGAPRRPASVTHRGGRQMMLNGSGSDLFQVAVWERTKSATRPPAPVYGPWSPPEAAHTTGWHRICQYDRGNILLIRPCRNVHLMVASQ